MDRIFGGLDRVGPHASRAISPWPAGGLAWLAGWLGRVRGLALALATGESRVAALPSSSSSSCPVRDEVA